MSADSEKKGLDAVRESAKNLVRVERDPNLVGDPPPPDPPPPAPPPPDDPCDPFFPPAQREAGARLPLNDTGNGRRFALYYGDDVIYVPRVGWHVWDGKRWRIDKDDIRVRGLAQLVQDRIIDEIPHLMLEPWQAREIDAEPGVRAQKAALDDIDAADRTAEQEITREELQQKLNWIRKLKDRRSGMKSDHRGFAKTSGNKGRLDALLAESTVDLAREVDDLDADPLTLNTESGVLRFTVSGGGSAGFSKTADFELMPHDRVGTVAGRNAPQYITKISPVEFDRDARCPIFDATLARIQPNAENREFLQRWFGLNMTALPVQQFVFFFGAGANGKSLINELFSRILGDYSAKAKIESLIGRNRRGGGDATPDLMGLVGARAVRAAEPDEGERLQEGMIKELTGGESLLVRNLHSDFIEVKPHFKLTISGNHRPEIRGTDDGIWRRVLLVPFEVQIPESERDETLGDKLWDERNGILNWLIDGLLDYLEGGLRPPEDIVAATADYRNTSDPLGQFLRDACVVSGDPSDFVTARDLADGFNLWLDLRGDGMWGMRTISNRIKAQADKYRDPETGKTFTQGKITVTGYRGIRFTDMFEIQFKDAPRNHQGRPVAAVSSRGGET